MPKVISLVVVAVLITGVMGCKSKPSESQPPAAAPAAAPSPGQATRGAAAPPQDMGSPPKPVMPEAPDACRAPTEPGCNPCCEAKSNGSCVIKTWNTAGVPEKELVGVTPWYNSDEFKDGACPSQCRPCARCSQQAAQELQKLGARPECDCSKPPGLDACMNPESCGCYCSMLKRLSEACPELAPRRDAPKAQ